MRKRNLILSMGLSFVLATVVPRRSEALIVGGVTANPVLLWAGAGTVATSGVIFNFSASNAKMENGGKITALSIVGAVIGMILNQENSAESQGAAMDIGEDLTEKVDQGLYTENEKQEILEDLARANASHPSVQVQIAGLGYEQAIASIVQATEMKTLTASYLVGLFGVQK